MERIELTCPFCAGHIEATAARQTATTNCPHCGRTVSVPATPPPVLPSGADIRSRTSTSPFDVREPAEIVIHRRGDEVHLRHLQPERREQYRRRMNIIFAIGGILVLACILAILLHWRR